MDRITEQVYYNKYKLKRELTEEDINRIGKIETILEMEKVDIDHLEDLISFGKDYFKDTKSAVKEIRRELNRVLKEFDDFSKIGE